MAEEKQEQCCVTEEYRGPLHVVYTTCGTITIERVRGDREKGIMLDKEGYVEVWECDGYGCTRDIYKLNKRDAERLREMVERAGTLEEIVRFVLDRGELVDFE